VVRIRLGGCGRSGEEDEREGKPGREERKFSSSWGSE